jgi:hypothetical protein
MLTEVRLTQLRTIAMTSKSVSGVYSPLNHNRRTTEAVREMLQRCFPFRAKSNGDRSILIRLEKTFSQNDAVVPQRIHAHQAVCRSAHIVDTSPQGDIALGYATELEAITASRMGYEDVLG